MSPEETLTACAALSPLAERLLQEACDGFRGGPCPVRVAAGRVAYFANVRARPEDVAVAMAEVLSLGLACIEVRASLGQLIGVGIGEFYLVPTDEARACVADQDARQTGGAL